MANLMNNFKGGRKGSGFPDGWIEEITEIASEDIIVNDPILVRQAGGWDSEITYISSMLNIVPNSRVFGISFSPTGEFLAVGVDTTKGLMIYKKNGNTFELLSSPLVIPAKVQEVLFDPTDEFLAVGYRETVQIYKRAGDVFTKLPSPTQMPSGNVNTMAFSPTGEYFAVGGSYGFIMYKRVGDVFTKLPTFLGQIGGAITGVTFSPTGEYFAVGGASGFDIYKRVGDMFTKLPKPNIVPLGAIGRILFDPTGKYLVIGENTTTDLFVYKQDGDIFTKLSTPDMSLMTAITILEFDPSGEYMIVASQVEGFRLYKISNDIFINIPFTIANTSDLWASTFSPTGEFLAIGGSASPFVFMYSVETTTKLLKLNQVRALTNSEKIGIALETKLIGEQTKVNLFPSLNNLPR